MESEEISEVADLSDLLEPDPKPVRERKVISAPKRIPKATKAVEKEVKDALILMLTLPAGMLSMRDPICGGAILENAETIANRLVPIICRNPSMLKWFTGGSGYMDFVALAVALQPIASTVWSHHVTKSVGHDHDFGEVEDYANYTAPTFQAPNF